MGIPPGLSGSLALLSLGSSALFRFFNLSWARGILNPWLSMLLTFTVYLLFSSVPLLVLLYSLLFYSILFPYGRLLVECVGMFFIGVCRLFGGLLSVACGMYRYAFYRCVSVAWVVASLCLHSLYIFSSLMFLCFSLLFCTILF